MSNYKNAVKLIKEILPNKQNVVSLSVPLLEVLDDDYTECALFSQCVYWDERTEDEDGWFYKSYQDWYKECRVKERTCRRKLDNLKERGWIETEVRQDYRNQNQLYVRVCGDKWIEDMLHHFCSEDPDPADKMTGGEQRCGQNDRRVRSDLPEGADKMTVSSIYTKITPETTSEITISFEENEDSYQVVTPSENNKKKEGASRRATDKTNNKKPKYEVTDTDREELQVFLDIYNQEKPERWDRCNQFTHSRVTNLRRYTDQFGDRTIDMFRLGLMGAKRDYVGTKNWGIDEFIKPDKDWMVKLSEKVPENALTNPIAAHIQTPQDDKRARILERTARVVYSNHVGVVA